MTIRDLIETPVRAAVDAALESIRTDLERKARLISSLGSNILDRDEDGDVDLDDVAGLLFDLSAILSVALNKLDERLDKKGCNPKSQTIE